MVRHMAIWSDDGWAGNTVVYRTRTLTWTGMLKTSNVTYAQSTLSSFFSFITATPGLNHTTVVETVFPSFSKAYTFLGGDTPDIYGNLVLGSWLMPRTNFVGEKAAQHARTLIDIVNKNDAGSILLMMDAGGAVSNSNSIIIQNTILITKMTLFF